MGNKESVYIGKGNQQSIRPETFKTARAGQLQAHSQQSVMTGGAAVTPVQTQSHPEQSVMAGGVPTVVIGGPQKQPPGIQKMAKVIGGETGNVLENAPQQKHEVREVENAPKQKQEVHEVEVQQANIGIAPTPQKTHRSTLRKPSPSPHRRKEKQEVPAESVFAVAGAANMNQNQGIQQSVFVGDVPQAKEVPSSPRPKPSTHGKASQKSSKQPQPAFYTEAEPKPANIPKPGTPAIQVHQEQKPAETKPRDDTAMNPDKLLYPTFRPQLMDTKSEFPHAQEAPHSARPKPSTHGKESQKSSPPQPVFYVEVIPKPASIPKPGTPAIQVHQEQKPAETKPMNETAMNPDKLLYPTFRPQIMDTKSEHEDDDKEKEKHKQHKRSKSKDRDHHHHHKTE